MLQYEREFPCLFKVPFTEVEEAGIIVNIEYGNHNRPELTGNLIVQTYKRMNLKRSVWL